MKQTVVIIESYVASLMTIFKYIFNIIKNVRLLVDLFHVSTKTFCSY